METPLGRIRQSAIGDDQAMSVRSEGAGWRTRLHRVRSCPVLPAGLHASTGAHLYANGGVLGLLVLPTGAVFWRGFTLPAQALGQVALTYLPAMNTLFQTAPIGWQPWLRIFLVAAVVAVVVAVDKRRLRGRPL